MKKKSRKTFDADPVSKSLVFNIAKFSNDKNQNLFNSYFLFIIILVIELSILCNSVLAHEIHLKNGSVIKTETCWEEDGKIKYSKDKSIVEFDPSQIKMIIYDDDKSSPSYHPKIIWKGKYPYIDTGNRRFKSLSKTEMIISGHSYTYKNDEGTSKRGRLFKDGKLIAIFENGQNIGFDAVKAELQNEEKLSQIYEKNSAIMRNQLQDMESFILKAKTWYIQKEYELALENLETAGTFYDYDFDKYSYVRELKEGDKWKEKGQCKKALTHYNAAIEIYPGFQAYESRGETWHCLGDKTKSDTDEEISRKIIICLSEIYYYRGICLLDLDQIDKAAYEYENLKIISKYANHPKNLLEKFEGKLHSYNDKLKNRVQYSCNEDEELFRLFLWNYSNGFSETKEVILAQNKFFDCLKKSNDNATAWAKVENVIIDMLISEN